MKRPDVAVVTRRGSIVQSQTLKLPEVEETPRWVGPRGFLRDLVDRRKEKGRHGLPSTHYHFPEAVQWESGI